MGAFTIHTMNVRLDTSSFIRSNQSIQARYIALPRSSSLEPIAELRAKVLTSISIWMRTKTSYDTCNDATEITQQNLSINSKEELIIYAVYNMFDKYAECAH